MVNAAPSPRKVLSRTGQSRQMVAMSHSLGNCHAACSVSQLQFCLRCCRFATQNCKSRDSQVDHAAISNHNHAAVTERKNTWSATKSVKARGLCCQRFLIPAQPTEWSDRLGTENA